MQDTEAELLLFNAIQQGDEKALEVVFLRYYRLLCRYAGTLLKNEAEGQEIAADVFLMLWEKRQTIEVKESLRKYLFTMTRNRGLRQLKTHNQTPEILELTSDTIKQYESNLFASEEANNAPSILTEYLASYIEQLPPQRQHIFNLNKVEGLSYSEIAQRLGLSEKTVRNHIYRAMLRLKKLSPVLFLIYYR